jgi:flavin reductase (DIM6/NTAB) family NADH-FMN oxidoreductase RutF
MSMDNTLPAGLTTLPGDHTLWERVFTLNPLVVIGTRDCSRVVDLAPKDLAIPMSWENHFGFVCAPSHRTYQNIIRTRVFTVSYPKPTQLVIASLTAAPRCDDGTKPELAALPVFEAQVLDGVLLRDAYLCFECRLDRFVEGLGGNSLVIGRIAAAHVDTEYLRDEARDDHDLIYRSPLLAYLHPGRTARVSETFSFPFPAGFKR